MKKTIQNVLAQNSTGEIVYICGNCAKEIDKEDKVCPHCGSRLGYIKCPFCNFKGDVEDFRDDTCPRCGRKKSEIFSGRIFSDKKKENDTFVHKSYIPNYKLLLFVLICLSLIGIVVFIKYFEIL